MIEVFDSIESSGYPLGFCVDRTGRRDKTFSGEAGQTVLKVEARALGAHQKEAVVTEGEAAPRWRMVSDEGPQLKGSDLAPFPLGFFNAGLQTDLLGNIDRLNQAAGNPLSSVTQTLVNRYTFSGSFFAGTGEGQAEAAEIRLQTEGSCSPDEAAALVSQAVRTAFGLSAMSTPLDCTFAIYVNGIRRTVTGVTASAASDARDPLKTQGGPPRPLADGRDLPWVIKKTSDYLPPSDAMPSASSKYGLEVLGRSELSVGSGQARAHTTLKAPPGSEFGFQTHEGLSESPSAPSGLALLSAGIAFCYMTQLLRYAEYLKYKVRAIRMVQFNPFERSIDAQGLSVGRALPVDTHLFLHGEESDEVMQKLLAMGANTCYLHAALKSALSPRVTLVHQGQERQIG
ncbi:MAG: hypothetical protein RLZZ344_470 [Pseudomonadota bacterium]|jgi:hypothetical protein